MPIYIFHIQATSTEQQLPGDNPVRSLSQGCNFVDLPEEAVRQIFAFLTDADVYFNVRYACRHLRLLAEDYVQLGKTIYNW